MEEFILISQLNDFTFCPVSIYFHNLYKEIDKAVYQSTHQVNGTNAHKTIDTKTYSDKKNILQGISVFSKELGIMGKIDLFDIDKGILTERKNKIKSIYDGYIFQLYAQYYALTEMGYKVVKLRLYSMTDNKIHNIPLPVENPEIDNKFKELIIQMKQFKIDSFEQTNKNKCQNCIYEPSCYKSLVC